ncbi:MAG: NAD(P)H-dependent oxidoreductase [candidate division Zixibacteria bacterium]|nr:NAD(P)H-dependent oxidoreductase [candidate division Zixibacteria bacterium]
MSFTPKILAFAGSAREGSYNKMLVKIAAEGARKAGADVTYVDFHDLPMPLYDQDGETAEGVPDNARKFKAMMKASDGFLISSPENNSSISALMKNVIDWASRMEEGEKNLECYVDKVAVIMAASPGGLGGLRGLYHLRGILESIQTLVLPQQTTVRAAHKAFNDDGSIIDEKKRAEVEALGATLANTIAKLKS